MSDDILQVHLNLAAMSANYLRALQHHLDIVKLLETGANEVTSEQVAAQRDFASFSPAQGAQLEHEAARTAAKDWLLKGFLRDAIETTGLYLDECLHACAILDLASVGGQTKAETLNRVFNVAPQKNHRLHLPEKLKKLQDEYGVQTELNEHVVSLNKARACVVHRLGTVTTLDLNSGQELKLLFRTFELITREEESGDEMLLDRPGLLIRAASVVSMRVVDKHRSFKLGDQVRLEATELYATIITLWQFGAKMAKAVEDFGRGKGLAFDSPEAGA